MAYPSHVTRDALRAALRAHPDRDTILNGRRINNLPLADLYAALQRLGVDVQTVTDTARVTVGNSGRHAQYRQGEPDDTNTEADDTDMPDTSDTDATVTDAIDAELAAIRGLIVNGGFVALDERLRELVTEARKPPVEVRVEVPVAMPAGTNTAPVVLSRPTGAMATWRALFNVKGTMGTRETALWDGTHPDTPSINPRYVWPAQISLVLSQIARGRNVLLYGPAGTGKTECAQQLAARTGRPYALISCDASTDGPTLVGMTVPCADGVSWQDGQLTRAIQTPGCVICLDEPSVARPGALFVLQNVLANRVLFITETGRRVPVAKGVVFMATDNTNGTGGGGRRGYTDTNRLNAAFLDRFGVRVKFDFMPASDEAKIVCSYVPGCTPELAALLVNAAVTTRACADQQQLTAGIGLRRLLAWAELLVDGIGAEDAFNAAVLNCVPEQDVETLRQQCLLAYDAGNVAAALCPAPVVPPVVTPDASNDPAFTNPSTAGRLAAASFRGV
jgi:MoxR-like ATPase